MIKHACVLIICAVISAVVCGLIGEALWPSGSYAVISASVWLAAVAVLVAPIAYVVVALTRHDIRLLRNENVSGKRNAILPTALTALVVAIVVTFGLGAAKWWLGD